MRTLLFLFSLLMLATSSLHSKKPLLVSLQQTRIKRHCRVFLFNQKIKRCLPMQWENFLLKRHRVMSSR